VVPSIWPEPFPLAALEANLLGTPVVASNIGGLPELIIDGTTGFLAKPSSPQDLADKIVKTLETPFQKGTIHEATAKRFDPLLLTQKLEAFLGSFRGT